MGIQDRDYYWEHRDKLERDGVGRKLRPRRRAVAVDLRGNVNSPKLWGANFHWSIKLLVWLAIAVLMLLAMRLARGLL